MKNPLTPPGVEPATFRIVAQHLNHCATAVPSIKIYEEKLPNVSTSHKKTRIISATALKQIMQHCLKCSMRTKKRDFSMIISKETRQSAKKKNIPPTL